MAAAWRGFAPLGHASAIPVRDTLHRTVDGRMQTTTHGMFEEVDRRLGALARAATAPVEPQALPFVDSPPKSPGVTWLPAPPADDRVRRIAVTAAAIIAALGLVIIAALNIAHLLRGPETLTGKAA